MEKVKLQNLDRIISPRIPTMLKVQFTTRDNVLQGLRLKTKVYADY